MTTKRKVLLAVIVALAIIFIAIAVIMALYMNNSSGSGSDYNTLLTQGQKYMDDQEDANAVLFYQKAVDLEPEKEDGYIGLAQAYIAQNTDESMELAEAVLIEGFARTQSVSIQNMIHIYFPTDTEESGSTQEQEPVPVEEVTGTFAINTELLDLIIGNTYNDYRLSGLISSESMTDGVYTVTIDSMCLRLQFYNTSYNSHVIDPNTNKPYSTCKPNVASVTDISALFGLSTVTYETLSAQKLSALTLNQDDDYGWAVSFSYEECSIRLASSEDGTIVSGAENEIIPPQTSDTDGDYVLSGRVLSATTGNGLSGAELEIVSVNSGETVTTTSETGGYYSVALEPGSYEVTVSYTGYLTETFDVTVNYTAVTSENFTISPVLGNNEIRIVLEWGDSPRDLDSYLIGTTDSGTSIRTWWQDKRATASDGTLLAELDVDDVDGYGPETTTLYDVNGSYQFVVVDFNGTGTMSDSGATVKVYVGSNAPVTINICSGLENGWLVCYIDHGVATVANTRAETVNGIAK
ncbi:MAG: carboxypeptidase regulatory-like domain-containing protein [Clostridiales bacterium]|nr:carboxypeptidase regulatory-like domain-containing protein [Clostridiales bacterium]